MSYNLLVVAWENFAEWGRGATRSSIPHENPRSLSPIIAYYTNSNLAMSTQRGVEHNEQGRIGVGDAIHGLGRVDVHDGGSARVFGPLLLRRRTLVLGRFRVRRIFHESQKVFLFTTQLVIRAQLAVIKVLERGKALDAVRLTDGIVFGAIHAREGHFRIVTQLGRRRREVRLFR